MPRWFRLRRRSDEERTSDKDATMTQLTQERISDLPKYALITPARNEARLIEATIRSVVGQTVCPLKWVIVSDGSTDGTDEIVSRYAAKHEWIELVRMPERKERHFAGKAMAINAGRARLEESPYEA